MVVAFCLACIGLFTAAALVPAPPVVVPFVAIVCVGSTLLAGVELSSSIRVLRDPEASPLRRRHLEMLRRTLERMPETEHPLGL